MHYFSKFLYNNSFTFFYLYNQNNNNNKKKQATAVSSTELSTGDTEIKYVPPISGEFTLLGEKTK